MARRASHHAVLAAWLVSSGCYASHVAAPSARDAGVAVDAATCSSGRLTEVRIEPPLPAGHLDSVEMRSAEIDHAVAGIRYHLDTCPGAAVPCLHDAVVVGIGIDLGVEVTLPPTHTRGSLDWDGSTSFHFLQAEIVSCGGCVGGQLEVLAGALVAPAPGGVRVSRGATRCSDDCDDHVGVVTESHGTTLHAAQGTTDGADGELLRVTADGEVACVRCACTLPSIPPNGLFVRRDFETLGP